METEVAKHYGVGGLRERLEAAFANFEGAVDLAALGAVDEFHVGGRPATRFLVDRMGLGPDDRVLDVGSGLGGLARFIASTVGASVVGVDLTAEYVDVARWLTTMTGLQEHATFLHGSASDLDEQVSAGTPSFSAATPSFSAATPSFSAATMLHVGMNIADKGSVFSQVASLLGEGGQFAIYDLMATGSAQPDFPVPWAATPATSFVESPDAYAQHLENAGFTVLEVVDRTDATLEAMTHLAGAQEHPPALGLHLVMGPETAAKVGNLGAAMRAGILAPTIVRATL